jgi:hypothetical protein
MCEECYEKCVVQSNDACPMCRARLSLRPEPAAAAVGLPDALLLAASERLAVQLSVSDVRELLAGPVGRGPW